MLDTGKIADSCGYDMNRGYRRELAILLNRSREGDERAFARLVKLYEPGLLKTSKRILSQVIRSEVDTEDLIQSVHWSIWQGLQEGRFEIESVERLLGFARSILRRKVSRVWRTLERRRRLQTSVNAKARSREKLSDPDEITRRISAEDQFEHLCTMMTSTERRLIELRMLGYSTAEAAREMGREPESLRVTLARLRSKLRASGILSGASDPKSA